LRVAHLGHDCISDSAQSNPRQRRLLVHLLLQAEERLKDAARGDLADFSWNAVRSSTTSWKLKRMTGGFFSALPNARASAHGNGSRAGRPDLPFTAKVLTMRVV
jgi:hypothetical protein